MILKFVTKVFPLVKKELAHWSFMAERIPDPELRMQALASIQKKAFHAYGGSIYALYPGADLFDTVCFIVALQTISDYLDNLCDRAGIMDEAAFFQLHLAMRDAVDFEHPLADYYRFYPFQNDRGYLASLVVTCRQLVQNQPSYQKILPLLLKYITWYSQLQSYKHLALDIRESRLLHWAMENLDAQTGIRWWEFAAATGSTLGMFLLYVMASAPHLEKAWVAQADRAYFPWVSGLHILLDYFIDAEEDRRMGDFNFTSQYQTMDECCDRLEFFMKQAVQACLGLPYPPFHLRVIRGLLAMYLSDPKALVTRERKISLNLVRTGGIKCQLYHRCCLLLRRLGRI